MCPFMKNILSRDWAALDRNTTRILRITQSSHEIIANTY